MLWIYFSKIFLCRQFMLLVCIEVCCVVVVVACIRFDCCFIFFEDFSTFSISGFFLCLISETNFFFEKFIFQDFLQPSLLVLPALTFGCICWSPIAAFASFGSTLEAEDILKCLLWYLISFLTFVFYFLLPYFEQCVFLLEYTPCLEFFLVIRSQCEAPSVLLLPWAKPWNWLCPECLL